MQTNALAVPPTNVKLIDSIPNPATSRLSEVSNFVSSYRTATYSTAHIPPSGMGTSHNSIYNEKFNVAESSAQGNPHTNPTTNIEERLTNFKEDLTKQF